MKHARLSDIIWLWNQKENMVTANIHLRMANWLEINWLQGKRKMVLNAFRGSGKSSVSALFICWVLIRNPNARVLVLAADEALAKKMLRQVKKIIETHYLAEDLIPATKEQWSTSKLTVARTREWRDPSVLVAGLNGNITGARADLIVCDDVEVPKTSNSRKLRKQLREKLAELEFILTPAGSMVFLGTPHSQESIFSGRVIANLDDKPFFASSERLEIPIFDEYGKSQWPEVFSDHKISSLKERQGPYRFNSQMMLISGSGKGHRFNSERLRIYEDSLSYEQAHNMPLARIGSKLMTSQKAAWDPAFGGEDSCNSVVACVFGDTQGYFYLHDICYLRTDYAADEDAASSQCDEVIEFLRRNHLNSIMVENNGLGRFLPRRLRHMLCNKGLARIAVISHSSKINKAHRIIKAFDALLAARRLFINKQLLSSPFMAELCNWHESSNETNDGLDAVAQCLLAQPLRMEKTTLTKENYA